jgi:membrane-bound metal-dependent hydrolase YbcI (DUF457 family)
LPSPIAHAAAGYALYKFLNGRKLLTNLRRSSPLPWLLFIFIILSFLPDFDFLPGIVAGDYDAFHNSYSNSLLVGFGLALLIGLVGGVTKRSRFLPWFLTTLLAYEIHVVMDFFGNERGTMLLWPLTSERYQPPIRLFYGFHRSDGLWSISHLWTVITEMVFAVIVFTLVNFREPGKGFANLAGVLRFSRRLDQESPQ